MDQKVAEYLKHNEVGDAELFVDLFAQEYCYDKVTHTWYRWAGHYWQEDGDEGVLDAFDGVVKVYESELKEAYGGARKDLERRINSLNTFKRRSNILHLVASKLSSGRAIHWDTHPMRLPCANGIIDLKKGELVAGSQEDYQRAHSPTKFVNLKAPCPRWEKFLLEIMDGDEQMVYYLQRLVGYALSGTASEGVFPVLWGRGRNGKGTMLEVLGKVLGDFATPVSSSLLMEQTYTRSSSGPSPDLMKLQGRRLVWANETEEGRKLSASVVKWLVGGDSITARPMYGKEEITFRPTHTLFLLTNHKPQVDANDYAMWKRLHLIPFTQSFVDQPTEQGEHRRDPDLMHRFTKIEDQGILTWAVLGCRAWQEYGLFQPDTIKDITKEYADEEDYLTPFIIEAKEKQGTGWLKAVDLFQSYREWVLCRGLHPTSMTTFGRNLGQKVAKRRTSRGYEYKL